MRKPITLTILLFFSLLLFTNTNGQSVLNTTTVSGISNNNGSGLVLFNFANNNSYSITITDVESIVGTAGTTTAELWIRTTPLSGNAYSGGVTTGNGWTLEATGTFTGVANTSTLTTQPILSGISVTIPANTTYAMCIAAYSGTSGRLRYHTLASPNIPALTVTQDGCSILMGNGSAATPTNTSFGAANIPSNTSATFNNPRGFVGKISFVANTGVCTAPPTAGTATTNKTNVCSGESFQLNLSGNSAGTGQTYQWQRSATGTAPWTDIGTANNFPQFTTTQNATFFYRCAVTCSSITTYSDSVEVVSPALVNGIFTINKNLPASSTNFQTFTDAINYIKCGINGPVVFNVEPGTGPYNEQIEIPQIFGASTTNSITINGNGNTLQYSGLTGSRAGIFLNGADYIVIDSLTIDGTAGTFAWGIILSNRADSNVIRKCTINIGNFASTSTNYIGIVVNGSATGTAVSGNNGNGNTFENNTIIGGYYNYYFYGSSSNNTINNNNRVIGNTLRDSYLYNIYAIYQNGLIISKNDISRPNRNATSTASGVFLTTGVVGALVEKNRIYSLFGAAPASTSTGYGVYVAADATTVNPNRIINNAIYALGGNGTTYGVYNVGGDNMQVYHNTIVLNDNAATSGTAYGVYQTTAAVGIDVRNNIIVVSRSGTGIKRCVHYNTTTSTVTSNRNLLLMQSSTGTDNRIGQWGTTGFTTLADWQTANSNAFDQQSISIDPLFTNVSNADFLPTESQVDDKGEPLGVLTDILDSVRNTMTPDVGAWEIPATAGVDMRPEALVSPALSPNGCYNIETITVRIRNASADPINFAIKPVTVSVNVTGAASATYTAIINTGTLAAAATQDVTMATPGATLDMSTAGGYNFEIVTNVVGDVNTANDIINVVREKQNLSAGSITVAPRNFCGTGGTPTLSVAGATGFNTVKWQTSNTLLTGYTDIPGATTTTYTLTTPISQTTYFRMVAICGINEENTDGDSATITNPQIATTTGDSRCGPGTLTLNATASSPTANIKWYANATGGLPLATGSPFITPLITNTTTFYVAAEDGGSTQFTGISAATSNATSGAGTANYGIVFDALQAFELKSVVVYPVAASANVASTITISVVNSANTIIHTQTVNVVGNPVGSVTGQRVNLNFNIQPGTNLKLYPSARGSGITGLLFEPAASAPSGNYGYPYVIPGVLSINTSTLTAAPSNTARNDLYYYFYDWEVSTGCEGTRTAVLATVTPPTAITASATQSVLCSGGNTTLNVSSSNSNYVYNWLPFNIPGSSLNVSPTETTKYYVEASDAGTGCTALDSVTIFVQPTITGVTATPPAFCITGGTSQLSITPSTGYASGSLQWQSSSNNVTFNNISGANSATYTTPTISSTTYYKIQAKDGVGVVCSEQSVTVEYNNPQITSTTPNYRCGAGSVVLGATASGSASVNWYTAATGGTAVATGNSFTTPSLTNTTTYYVAANEGGSTVNVGKAANGTLTNLAAVPRGIQFNANNPFTILSVKVYSTSTTAGAGIITLYDAANNVVGTPVNVSWPGGGSTAAPVAHVLPLNIAVPSVGTNYKLMMTTFSSGGIGYESSGMSPAAYTALSNTDITFNGSMTSLTALSTSTYYYFYDWQITTGCESPRTAITATIDNDPGCVPVPVSLVQFKGSKQGNVNRLEWVTVNEVNSKGFHVQRSSNGVNFSSIGFVASQQGGNSSSQQSYQFIDEQPLRGNNYYRLQQVDRDGSTSVSNVVLLRGDEVREIQIVGVYPNPTKGELTVQIQSPKAERVSVVLMDISGKQVVQQNHVLVQGSNQLKLNMSGVAQGSYLVKVICANGCQTTATKVVKE
jgi:hypothetical protein